MPTKEHVTKFQQIYSDHFGSNLSYPEAEQQLLQLLRLVEIVYFDRVEVAGKEKHETAS